mgnify:CR=1 FL=1
MQITHVEVIPVELALRNAFRTTSGGLIERIEAVFVRIETRQGEVAWGCAIVEPAGSAEVRTTVMRACQACAERARDLNPLHTEYALAEITPLTEGAMTVRCAFDMAFHDLLGLAAGMPLHRLLGGYRYRIQTSITLDVAPVDETVEMAQQYVSRGFRMLKIKGGRDPEDDVRRVQAIHDALPGVTLRLDAEGGYDVRQALDVARALAGRLEMLEQPTPAGDLAALREVTQHSPLPILADESVNGPEAALEIAGQRAAHGLSVKLSTCGGIHCGRQVDAIARAARMATMIGCVHQPALLSAAGLGLALSSPNVHYADLDGHFDLVDDPTQPGFRCEEGWLIATDVPGLGCTVAL